MKKILISAALLLMTTFFVKKTYSSEIDFSKHKLDAAENYIFANVNEKIDLKDYYVSFDTNNHYPLTSCVIEGTSVVENTISFNKTGANKIVVKKSENTLNVLIFIKNANEEKYTVFEDDFTTKTNTDFLSEYQLSADKSLYKLDSGLTIGTKNSSAKLFLSKEYSNLKSYDIETNFTILESLNESRWVGIVFRAKDYLNYYQMAIRQNAMLANGVEVSKALNNENWSVPLATPYTQKIEDTKMYTAKIKLNDNSVEQYIDNTFIQGYDGYTEYERGNIGLQSRNCMLKVANIKVTMDLEQVKKQEKKEYMFPEVYELDTKVLNPPTVMQKIHSKNDLDFISKAIRPQSVAVKIDDDLNVMDENKNRIATIEEFNNLTYGKVIANYVTQNEGQSLKLAKYLKENGILDFFITNEDSNILEKVKKENENAKNIYLYTSNKQSLTNEDLKLIYRNVALSYSCVLMLDAKFMDAETVRYFQTRMISVFSHETGGKIEESSYNAIYNGVNGVVTSDFRISFDILNSFTEKTYTRRPIIIGHRGLPALQTENTIEGCLAAVDSGAEIVELDLHLTSDKKIIVFHDFITGDKLTLNGAPISFDIAKSSYEDINKATLIDISGKNPNLKIPTLDEYLENTKHKNFVYNIELKSWLPDLVEYVKPILDKHNINDRIILTSFENNKQLPKAKELMPYFTQGVYATGIFTNNVQETVKNVNLFVNKLSTPVNPSYINVNYDNVKALQHRGITVWPWTVTKNDSNLFNSLYAMNVAGITTDNSSFSKSLKLAKLLKKEYEYNIYLDQNKTDLQNIQVRATLYNFDGFKYEMGIDSKVLTNNNTLLELSSNGKVLKAVNEGYEIIGVSYKTTDMADKEINYLVGTVKVNVLKEKSTGDITQSTNQTTPNSENTAPNKGSNCKKSKINTNDIVISLISLISFAGIATYLLKRK